MKVYIQLKEVIFYTCDVKLLSRICCLKLLFSFSLPRMKSAIKSSTRRLFTFFHRDHNNGVFPKCFSLNSVNSVTKIFVIEKAQTCHILKRDQDATTESVWHMWVTGSLNWVQFMLHWFIRFPEFAEFLIHLGEIPLFGTTNANYHDTFCAKS